MSDPEPSVSIRPAGDGDLDAVLAIERAAFGEDDEAELVRALLEDPSAAPLLSLLAFRGDQPVGHVLFTAARVEGAPEVTAVLLAPLAVIPEAQGRGIGAALSRAGLWMAAEAGTDLAFVLGHPTYYPRFDYRPARSQGFEPPYPIDPANDDAWMVLELRRSVLGSVRGRVQPADMIMRPEYWRE